MQRSISPHKLVARLVLQIRQRLCFVLWDHPLSFPLTFCIELESWSRELRGEKSTRVTEPLASIRPRGGSCFSFHRLFESYHFPGLVAEK